MDRYTLTRDQFLSLASGYGTPDAIAVLTDGRLARQRLLVLGAVERVGPAARDALGLLADVEAAAPAAVEQALRHPFLEVWAARTLRASAERARAGYLAALAAAAATSAGITFELTLPAVRDGLVLPGVGAATGLGHGAVRLRGDGERLTFEGTARRIRLDAPFSRESPHWRPARRISLGSGPHALSLLVEDVDPYRRCYTHPVARRLPAARLERLARACEDAWRILVREQPRHAAGMRAVLRALVPLRDPAPGAVVSATSREAFGAVALSAPSDVDRLAEALLHEYQHAKLSALADLVPLCEAGGPARYYAPWRPDPRPAGPLLDGAYAYTGVTAFWRARRRTTAGEAARLAEFEFAYWRRDTLAALRQLAEGGELTAYGELFVRRLRRSVVRWAAEPVSEDAGRVAVRYAVASEVGWRLAHLAVDGAEAKALAGAWEEGRSCPPISAARVVAGAPRVAQTAREAWLGGDRPLPDVAPTVLAQRAARTGDADDWVAFAVALHVADERDARAAVLRPELMCAVADRLRAAGYPLDLVPLARWLAAGLPDEASDR
ncbi:aKG-HExxH-type peptide beta-hydroxylase [Phytohabitans sp. LJ34]|uniref:aKG-HExxH-type peptide beta-hydroxylase n=1 Tax=Phytohabitans sp. LJ34 TaxID=3452217 RepID=UPI003F8960E6